MAAFRFAVMIGQHTYPRQNTLRNSTQGSHFSVRIRRTSGSAQNAVLIITGAII